MNITVWNENYHEKLEPHVLEVHPGGLHETVAGIIREMDGVTVRTATLDMPEAGLSQEVCDNTDVLLWWGHMAHDKVPDEVVERVWKRVMQGMGLVVLHSGHHSKIFRKLMGTTCNLRWRDGAYERIFNVNPSHPIAKGIPMNFELGIDECYAEFFDIPQPDEQVFEGWFDIGEVFRSGCCWRRGFGKIFYFQPGHETNRAFYNPYVRQIIKNAVEWAAPSARLDKLEAPEIRPTLEEIRAGKTE